MEGGFAPDPLREQAIQNLTQRIGRVLQPRVAVGVPVVLGVHQVVDLNPNFSVRDALAFGTLSDYQYFPAAELLRDAYVRGTRIFLTTARHADQLIRNVEPVRSLVVRDEAHDDGQGVAMGATMEEVD